MKFKIKRVQSNISSHPINSKTQSSLEALKSAGTWFFFGNALLNGQSSPVIPWLYAVGFALQRIAKRELAGKAQKRTARFLTGTQGPLFLNAAETAVVGVATTILHPSSPLINACFAFAAANATQALIYDNVIKFPADKAQGLKNLTLVLCETTILYGLDKVAQNAGFSPEVASSMVIPGMLAAFGRSFYQKKIPPSIAYVDMMAVALATCVQAFSNGNYLNGCSRILAIIGFSCLAITRAQAEGKSSIFEVEKWNCWHTGAHEPI